MKENKNLKIHTKLLALILAGESLIISCTSCAKTPKNEELVSTNYVLEHFCDSTSLDEIFENPEIVKKITFEDITQLETMLGFSENLYELDLYKNKISLNSIGIEKVSEIDFTAIDSIINEYNILLENGVKPTELCDDSIELYICREKLKNYDNLVNAWLKNSGYGIVEEWGKLVVKSMIIDALDLDASKISNIKIDANISYNTSNQTDNTITITDDNGNEKKLLVKRGSIMDEAINTIYSTQLNITNAQEDYDTVATYSKDRNKILNDALNLYKICIPLDAVLSDKKGTCLVDISGNRKNARELIASETYVDSGRSINS